MVEKLKQQKGIISIYLIGSISTPGISDIDMVVVFEDVKTCQLNPLYGLSRTDRYLFIHDLYGASRKYFNEAQRYTFFHNYSLLWGEDIPIGNDEISKDDVQGLKVQIALEYMTKMYIDIVIERTYGICKLRKLFLHVKALSYDLEFLNINSGNLFDLVEEMILWRSKWFKEKQSKRKLAFWINNFHEELESFLKKILENEKLFFPDWANLYISRNIILKPSEKFGYIHEGMTLPAIFRSIGRKYFNIQHRFNKFKFLIPLTNVNFKIQEDRLKFQKKMKVYNEKYIKYLSPLNSCLNIF